MLHKLRERLHRLIGWLFPTRADAIGLCLTVAVTLGLGVMLWRVWQLQARPSADLLAFKGERTSRVVEQARRGDLTDRRGRPLAVTKFGYRVFVDPAAFPTKDTDVHIVRLSEAIGVPADQFGPKLLARMVSNQRKQEQHDAEQAAYEQAVKVRAAAIKAAEKLAREMESQGQPEAQATISEAADTTANAPEDSPAGWQPAQTADNATPDPALGPDGLPPEPAQPGAPRLARYMPVGAVLPEERVDLVRKLKIPGVHLETRQVREVIADELVGSLLGKVGLDKKGADKGIMGSELKLDATLQPESGSFRYVRDARGRPLWVYPESYIPAEAGDDLALSIDLELQRIVTEELRRGMEEVDAAGGRAVMMDPRTGEVLAMVDLIRDVPAVDYDWQTVIPKDNEGHGTRYRTIRADPGRAIHPSLGRNRCVEDVYEPGSTFKAFVWAAVTQRGLMNPRTMVDCHGGQWRTPYGRAISDVTRRGMQTWQEVLINSSNIGMAQGAAKMSFEDLHNAVRSFGFGSRAGTGLPGETAGIVTPVKRWSVYSTTSVAMGHEVAVTPVQVARAFCAFSRTGSASGTLPRLRMQAFDPRTESSGLDVTHRVVPAQIADLVRDTLRGVTASLDRKLAAKPIPEEGWRYELYGKSGTAEIPLGQPPEGLSRPKGSDGYFNGQYNSSFIAGGPVQEPRLVMIAVIDDPGPEFVRAKLHRGSTAAGPVVRRTMERALTYLGVPPSPPVSEDILRRGTD